MRTNQKHSLIFTTSVNGINWPYFGLDSLLKARQIEKVKISLDFINYICMMPRILNNECYTCYE